MRIIYYIFLIDSDIIIKSIRMNHKIFKNSAMPHIELRYAKQIRGCSKSHTHEMITISAIENGKVDLILLDTNKDIAPGIISILNPNIAHCVEVLNKNSYGDYVLHVDTKWCTELQQEVFNHNNDFTPFSSPIVDDFEIYTQYINLCNKLLDNSTILEKEEKLIEFMTNILIYDSSQTTNLTVQAEPNKNEISKQIKSYLDSNFLNEITLKDISSKLDLSIVHIIRLFKKEYQLPIHSYILNKKVHKARELLSEDISLVDVAHESGFYDQSHFHKSFKRVFSISPKEYQDNLPKS